jgi:large subunit ribosomal protein L17e
MGKEYSNTTAGQKKNRKSMPDMARASGKDLTCHYKQMSEVGRAIKGMKLKKCAHMQPPPAPSSPGLGARERLMRALGRAVAYLQRVTSKKDVIPYMIHKGGKGRHALAKNHKTGGSGFPLKSSQMMLKLLENVESNTKSSSLEGKEDNLVLNHVQVNRARKMRRRTYRAHGRMGPYVRSPCHVELTVTEATKAVVPKPKAATQIVTRKTMALARWNKQSKVPVGGGAKA